MRSTLLGLALVAGACLTPLAASAGENEDKAFAQNVASVLRDSGRLQNYSVGVKYKEGTVWLAGRVTSKEQLATALQVASDIDGVNSVVNNMSVGPGKAPQQASPIAATGSGRAVPAGYRQLPGAPAPQAAGMPGRPMPSYVPAPGNSPPPAAYDQPYCPNYSWPSYAAYPNYAAVTYPKQYSATAWPFIGPFYPYPQVPMGWRKVSLEWDDGWWFLDFDDRTCY